jgi:hypothetical protein
MKATGRSLSHASAADFVVVSLQRLSDIVDDFKAGDADVAGHFDEIENEQGMRRSVEALLHVACVVDAGGTTVAHTHPESVNALLCSDRADVLAGPPIFPDPSGADGASCAAPSVFASGRSAGARGAWQLAEQARHLGWAVGQSRGFTLDGSEAIMSTVKSGARAPFATTWRRPTRERRHCCL